MLYLPLILFVGVALLFAAASLRELFIGWYSGEPKLSGRQLALLLGRIILSLGIVLAILLGYVMRR